MTIEAGIKLLRDNSYTEAADMLDDVNGRECHICHQPRNQPGRLYCSAPHYRLIPWAFCARVIEELKEALCTYCAGEGCDVCEETGLHGASSLHVLDVIKLLEEIK